MTSHTLMIQGSSSSAGKSLLVTALCRIYARRGVRVAPFKAQNMSNNAAVCADGSEIGRAQALQAIASGLPPTVDMNPVLIKPEADSRSQVVLMGRPWHTLEAKNYYEKKAILWEHVTAALDRLRSAYDLIIMEGAGSPAELNLRAGDIVNMAVACHVNAPVLLVGDIDRGGIFAQLLGTLWLLEPEERALVRGFLVNKFRGDLSLFKDGVNILEQKGDVPVLGVIPYLHGLNLPDEDAVSVETASRAPAPDSEKQIDIAVLHLPRIANFDDFDSLRAEPGVLIRYVESAMDFGHPDAVIIPGTKSTIADLEWLNQVGLAQALIPFARAGGTVVGICGGYQMLGETISDPDHVESNRINTQGLGLLPIQTRFLGKKSTYQVSAIIQRGGGWLDAVAGQRVIGYEIHMGESTVPENWLEIRERNGKDTHIPDGAMSEDRRVWGCYLHGIFVNDTFRRAWLSGLGWRATKESLSHTETFNRSLDELADAVENSLDMKRLEKIIWES